MTDHVKLARAGAVLEVTLNRATKKNALTGAMYRKMTGALQTASDDADIRAVLFLGDGDAFSAGNDLNDFLEGTDGGAPALEFIRALAAFGKPIVAAVQGLAVGIGTTMLFHCDLVYAAPDARFLMPFVNLGLVPEAGSSLLAPLRLGHAKAAAMLQATCPAQIPEDTTARLDAMSKRLKATVTAMNEVKPALTGFYDSLSDEQKARFNTMPSQ